MVADLHESGRRGGASLHVNGIDPGFANDLLPLVLSSLSQRIDHVAVSEIADYSTYYQPVVMSDIYGFGKPMDHRALLWEPGILSTAWGPVVRLIAAGLGVTLDEPLLEEVDRRPAERDVETRSVHVPAGTMGAVRFKVIGTVDGVARITLDHVTRTAEDQDPDWPTPPEGDGCYRVAITGEPTMQLDFVHHGESGDHNVCGMITTAQRLVNAMPAVCAAEPGLVTVLDLPLVTGRGLVRSTTGMSILDRFAITDQVAMVTGAGRGIGAATAIGFAEAGADVVISSRTEPSSTRSPRRSARPAAGRWWCPPTSATPTRSPAWRRRRSTNSAASTPWSTTSAATSRTSSSKTDIAFFEQAFHFNVSTAHALSVAAVPLMLEAGRMRRSRYVDHVDDGPKRRSRLPCLRHRQGGTRALEPVGGDRPRTEHPGQRGLRRVRADPALEFVAGVPEMKQELEDNTPLGRIGEAEDIAAAALYLSSPAGAFVTGKMLEVDGGIQAPNLDLNLPDVTP